jgi:hypothetical protein
MNDERDRRGNPRELSIHIHTNSQERLGVLFLAIAHKQAEPIAVLDCRGLDAQFDDVCADISISESGKY